MKRFWPDVIEPVLTELKPRNIVEIGADTGINTRHLLEFCRQHDCKLTSIDPKPSYDVDGFCEEYGDLLEPVFAMSLDAIPKLGECDVMLIDGDHNWYTVYHELMAVQARYGDAFPVVMFHDTAWPYGRRDMYYDPSNVPAEYVQPIRQAGLIYGESDLAEEGGFNPHLHQAIDEGTPRNGVLTAIEDFQNESELDLELVNLVGFNGLSLLYQRSRQDVTALLETLDPQRKLAPRLEESRILGDFAVLKRDQALAESKTTIADLQTQLQAAKAAKDEQTAQLREMKRELMRTKELAQSMRMKSRIKRLFGLHALRPGDVARLMESVREDGLKTTLLKVKQRLRDGGPPGKKPKAAQGRPRKLKQAERSAAEIATLVAGLPVPPTENTPLVSIIILTHNGLGHLQRLFPALEAHTDYPQVEVIVVDNASTDGSREFLASLESRFPIHVIENARNESYSRGHNQAAELAKGEYLLFLNNDIVPLHGWLNHLVRVAETHPRTGSVGAQLIYPDAPDEPLSGLVQHSGIVFEYEYSHDLQSEFMRPYNHGFGELPLLGENLPVEERMACTAACLLVPTSVYHQVGGLDENYVYGYEDVDFGLRLKSLGLTNWYCPSAVLIHHESSTQKSQASHEVRDRRLKNMRLLRERWHDKVYQHYFAEKLGGITGLHCEQPLHIAFAVTEAGPDVSAGDYFTALELANALQARGCTVSFLTRRGGSWYDVAPEVDVIVSMLDSFDLSQVQQHRKKLIHIAWVRNWPERWLENPSLSLYDLILCASDGLCEQISEAAGRPTELFPIATNPARFDSRGLEDKAFASDYVFTGSYWGKSRDIGEHLKPAELDFDFALYGKNWEQVDTLKDWHRGFLPYGDVPKAYANTRIVIDDAAVSTRDNGSVNSRVFDALAAGALVISNQQTGTHALFGDTFPAWHDQASLHDELNHWLTDEPARQARVNELRAQVLASHTYEKRADELLSKLKTHCRLRPVIAIKVPCPYAEEAESWGDFHLARGLRKYFEREGCSVQIQFLYEWDNGQSDCADLVIVLRGLSEYSPKPHQRNVMWNISHPDKVSDEEYQRYDHVFVASALHAKQLSSRLSVPVDVMHQCTDPEEFNPESAEQSPAEHHELLFVGNSRKVFRKSLKDLLPTDHDLAVYGAMWDGIIDPKYIKGEHIPNHQLAGYYAKADILLNDHWDAMRESGFVSNRIFDGLAAGALIVTDWVKEMETLFPEGELITYETPEELHAIIEDLLSHPEKRAQIAGKARQRVLSEHTFAERVEQFLKAGLGS